MCIIRKLFKEKSLCNFVMSARGKCLYADIIDILQLQYKPFLLLAAQLQTTHEHVQVSVLILLSVQGFPLLLSEGAGNSQRPKLSIYSIDQ